MKQENRGRFTSAVHLGNLAFYHAFKKTIFVVSLQVKSVLKIDLKLLFEVISIKTWKWQKNTHKTYPCYLSIPLEYFCTVSQKKIVWRSYHQHFYENEGKRKKTIKGNEKLEQLFRDVQSYIIVDIRCWPTFTLTI